MSDNTRQSIEALRKKVQSDAGAPEFVLLADALIESQSTRAEAREILFAGLSASPKNSLGRLLLAKSFYLDGMSEFCARELVELRRITTTPALDRLFQVFAEYVPDAGTANAGPKNQLNNASESTGSVPNSNATDRPSGRSMEEIVGELDLDADFDLLEDELK